MCKRQARNQTLISPPDLFLFWFLFDGIFVLTCDDGPGPVMVVEHVVPVLPPGRGLHEHAGQGVNICKNCNICKIVIFE